ncbi:hypothetical protein As57867_003497, partial [Aphanomyces stellatus]
DERESILREVLLRSNGSYMERLPKGFGRELAQKYTCDERTIRKILQRAKAQGIANGNMHVSVANRKKGNVGRKKAFTAEQIKEKLLAVPLADRTSFRSISEKTGIKLGTLHRCFKAGMFRAHSSAIRPFLTDANKYARLTFAASKVGHDMTMNAMLDHVHLDEKWFYITKETRKFYLAPGEKGPDRKCKSKRYITKVMFLSAVARPRFVEATGEWWDGKIGTWPFVAAVPANRSSCNRPAGTMETKAVTVTKDVYRARLIDDVLPAIVAKWPDPQRVVTLQHDNARAHVTASDEGLRAAFAHYKVQGWSMTLEAQPPNSPDTNILDLGFFAAIQSLQHRSSAHTIDELVVNVHRAFDTYPAERLAFTFLSLQACLIETLRVFGDNFYAVPHHSKQKLARKGLLPENMVCPRDVFDAAKCKLEATDSAEMERVFAAEQRDERAMIDLARMLETLDVSNDMADVLVELGIEPIDVE